jgi:hypothetical protein
MVVKNVFKQMLLVIWENAVGSAWDAWWVFSEVEKICLSVISKKSFENGLF